MEKMILNLLAFFMLIGLTGCEDDSSKSPLIKMEPKILVANAFGAMQKVPVVDIISLTDSLTIENVVANNGNCKMTAHRQEQFPKKMKYGQKVTAGYTVGCNLIKVEVITDKGTWTQEFDDIPEQFVQM